MNCRSVCEFNLTVRSMRGYGRVGAVRVARGCARTAFSESWYSENGIPLSPSATVPAFGRLTACGRSASLSTGQIRRAPADVTGSAAQQQAPAIRRPDSRMCVWESLCCRTTWPTRRRQNAFVIVRQTMRQTNSLSAARVTDHPYIEAFSSLYVRPTGSFAAAVSIRLLDHADERSAFTVRADPL